jgi:hypothetical protein
VGRGGSAAPVFLSVEEAVMATFIDLHQSQQLILVNVEAVQTVAPHLSGRPGAEVIFTNGTGIEVDETVEGIEALL